MPLITSEDVLTASLKMISLAVSYVADRNVSLEHISSEIVGILVAGFVSNNLWRRNPC
jgi:hypothetical protein